MKGSKFNTHNTGAKDNNTRGANTPSQHRCHQHMHVSALLDRLQCSSESWLDLVKSFRKRFRVEIGLASTLQSVSSCRRSHRFVAQG